MGSSLPERHLEELRLFQHHNRLLKAIREHNLHDPEAHGHLRIFSHCCTTLKEVFGLPLVWAGNIDPEQFNFSIYASSQKVSPKSSSIQHIVAGLLIEQFSDDFNGFSEPHYLHIDGRKAGITGLGDHHCLVWPIHYQGRNHGFIALHCTSQKSICELNHDFIAPVIEDVAMALVSQETAKGLRMERDFNKEILDTIQALMVTISPCGTILSFNRRAEEVTGYSEQETIGKYWVDVLISPHDRRRFQQEFSDLLKGDQANLNFQAPLMSKDGRERCISWHGSIRHHIESGTVGLVMLGIDETENVAADQQLNMLTARWEKIFNAIHDPVLLVSNENYIIDANPAACDAAKRKRGDVIGQRVCDVLHGGHGGAMSCPLEQFIGYQKTRITETELSGLHGRYMLTVSPLIEENGEINATLLVARNLTEEEVVRAEAIRVSQLAAIGELASGVAHEINNPINAIINYARIILDEPEDRESEANLGQIIGEGKRIAGIVSNLLSFARCGEELFAPADVEKIIANSVQLVAHQLKRDGITCSVTVEEGLPPLMCNEHQLQQVALNMISNSRYALNARYPVPCREKLLEISAKLLEEQVPLHIRISFTDHGIGIPADIEARLFDPFFSTKPKGEGTGLGLSISYGLVRDHGGYIRVQSNPGQWTTFHIDLPVRPWQ